MESSFTCFSCMHPLHSREEVCPACGYDNHIRSNGPGLLPETILNGQYLVGRVLGRGGFGITYIGYDCKLERVVAIKEFFPSHLVNRDSHTHVLSVIPDSRHDFQKGCQKALRESKMAARLGQIPGIVQVYNVFSENNTIYIVMEFIDGVTLTQYVKNAPGRISLQDAISLLTPVAEALCRLHKVLVITKDIIGMQSRFHDLPNAEPYKSEKDDTWENSWWRSYLNQIFTRIAFTTEEQSAIPTVTVRAAKHPFTETTKGAKNTQDQLFILSYDEIQKYFPTEESRKAQGIASHVNKLILEGHTSMNTSIQNNWMIRSPRVDKRSYNYGMCGIDADGKLVRKLNLFGLRPACWIDLSKAKDAVCLSEEKELVPGWEVGAEFTMGRFEQDHASGNGAEPIEWQVIKREGNRVLALSKHVLHAMKYDRDDRATWEDSTMREWLNQTFLTEAFTAQEQSFLAQRTMRPEQTFHGNPVSDRVFLLSRTELEACLPDEAARRASPTAYAIAQKAGYVNKEGYCWWWLRGSPKGAKYSNAVNSDGKFDSRTVNFATYLGVRPAIWVNLDSSFLAATASQSANHPEIQIGTHITFGHWEQDNDLANGPDPVEWLVLDRQDQRVLVMTKDIIVGPTADNYKHIHGHDYDYWAHGGFDSHGNALGASWEKSVARKGLNTTFLSGLVKPELRSAILTVDVAAEALPEAVSSSAGGSTRDQIFALSYSEVEKYLPDPASRTASLSETLLNNPPYNRTPSGGWCLRHPVKVYKNKINAAYISDSGIYENGWTCDQYRPACWIDLSKAQDAVALAVEETLVPGWEAGTKFTLGRYEQDNDSATTSEPIGWTVIHREGNRVLALSDHVLTAMKYHQDSKTTWEKSSIRQWLNGVFLDDAFSPDEKSVLAQRAVPPEQTSQGKYTTDYVFVLSRTELEACLPNPSDRLASPTPYAIFQKAGYVNNDGYCWWWLRDSPKGTKFSSTVNNEGHFDSRSVNFATRIGVRPAIWVNLDSENFSSVVHPAE